MSISLANKYRPQTLEEVCAQKSITKILSRQLETKQFKNCYLFSGPSGCGKTTIARILALEINKYQDDSGNWCSSEPIEIDAASNNGVENVRQIIEGATQRSLDGKYKIYIIDECHSISNQGWQALLKTIEETPKYTIFMFCTTEYHKVPVTIQNRCQQYFLTRIPDEEIYNRLIHICRTENYTFTDEALQYITKMAQGSARLGISYLDKCKDFSTELTVESVTTCLGNFSYDVYFNLINAIIDKNNDSIISTVESLYNQGSDLKLFMDLFISFVLDLSKFTIFKSFDIIKIPKTYQEKLNYTINIDGGTKYFNHILDRLLQTKQLIKNDPNIKDSLEISLLQL